jgi:hypothetical protein
MHTLFFVWLFLVNVMILRFMYVIVYITDILFFSLLGKYLEVELCQALVAHTCNPSCLSG